MDLTVEEAMEAVHRSPGTLRGQWARDELQEGVGDGHRVSGPLGPPRIGTRCRALRGAASGQRLALG